MNQKLSITMFSGGLLTFLTSLAELLSQHKTWAEMSAPNEIAHILVIVTSFVTAIIGAWGTNMPRTDMLTRKEDKVSESKLNEINNDRTGDSL